MAYTNLISRPGNQDLGLDWSDLGGGVTKVVDFFGAGLKAQGGQEALAAQLQAQNAAAAAKAQNGGISTSTLLIGGIVIAGVLVFAMRKKK